MNDRVRDTLKPDAAPALLRVPPARTLRKHPRWSNVEFTASLEAAGATVLPYRYGTHSGWAQLCWGLGTPILTPRVGHILEQHPNDIIEISATSPAVPAAALARVRNLKPPPFSDWRRSVAMDRRQSRRIQRNSAEARHEALCEGPLG